MQAQVHDVSGQVVPDAAIFWSSKDTNIVAVSQAGVVTGKSVGTTQIAASSNGQSAVVPVVVTPVGVASAAVAPSSAAITVGGTVVLQGIAYDASGNTLPGRTVVWASSAPQVATVDSKGKVTGVAAGTATITGTIEGRTASSVITVGVIPVATVAVTPGSAAINVGQSAALTAVTTDANGNTLTGRTITWASANTAVATVSASGLVTGVGAGTTTIRATSEGKTGTAQVAVTAPAPTPPSVASVTVTPSSTTLATGGTATLTATVKQSDGTVLTGRTVTWSSSAPNVATVSNSGVVTAVAPGNATITATSEGKSGTASVTVSAPSVASVSVNPAALTLTNNHPKTLTAKVLDAANHEITGRTITWTSSDSSLVSVTKADATTATVTAVRHGVGIITITATCDRVSGTSVVTLAY
jgi:trimeric autotransporter adhesin